MSVRLRFIPMIVCIIQSCGRQTNFLSSGATQPQPTAAPAVANAAPKLIETVNWSWNCGTKSETVPTGQAYNLTNEGPHAINSSLMAPQIQLNVSGQACPTLQLARDIVFVVDVSGSMDAIDPLVNGSCNRLRALEAAIKGIGENGASEFSVLTFDDQLQDSTSKFFKNLNDIYADIKKSVKRSNSGTSADFLCHAGGGTDYAKALIQARKLLQTGIADSLKQIVFVSDSAPSPGMEGLEVTKDLKNVGITISGKNTPVSIATLMLGTDDDSVLKYQIASTDTSGFPLHRKVVDVSELASVMTLLSQNFITQVTLDFTKDQKPLASAYPTTFDQKLNFDAKGFTLTVEPTSANLILGVNMQDRFGHFQKRTGVINFPTK